MSTGNNVDKIPLWWSRAFGVSTKSRKNFVDYKKKLKREEENKNEEEINKEREENKERVMEGLEVIINFYKKLGDLIEDELMDNVDAGAFGDYSKEADSILGDVASLNSKFTDASDRAKKYYDSLVFKED